MRPINGHRLTSMSEVKTKVATRSGRPTESGVSPEADRLEKSPRFDGVLTPVKNLTLESGTLKSIPSTPLSLEQGRNVHVCAHGITCMRTDSHHHTGEVLKGYARRLREKAAKAEANKKEKVGGEKRWHKCHLTRHTCPKWDQHGHINYCMPVSDLELADTRALTGKDGEEAIRHWERISDAPLTPYESAHFSSSHQCHHLDEGEYDSTAEESEQSETECPEQKNDFHDETDNSESEESEEEDVNNPAIPPLSKCQNQLGSPRISLRLGERTYARPTRPPIPGPFTIPEELLRVEDCSKFTLPASAEKERALEVHPPTSQLGIQPRGDSLRVIITTDEAAADANAPVELPPTDLPIVQEAPKQPERAPKEAKVDLLRTHEVFIFTDNDGANVVSAKKSFWHKAREYLAANTPLASKEKVNVVNTAGRYTLSELRSEIDKDVSGIRWFWQSKKNVKPEFCMQELHDFGRRYTHFTRSAVYTSLAEYVLKQPAFVARGSSLLRDGVVSQVTLLQIDKFLEEHPQRELFMLDMGTFYDTRNHLVNQVHLRGLRAEGMKVKVPGSATLVDFRKRARSMDVSPRVPFSKSERLTPLLTPSTGTMRGLSA